MNIDNIQHNLLTIDEYTKESEIFTKGTPELKIIYYALSNAGMGEPIDKLKLINDLRRIELFHTTDSDECVKFIEDRYKTRYAISSIFIECLKLTISDNSVFMNLLQNHPNWKLFSKTTQQNFALKLEEAKKQIKAKEKTKQEEEKPLPLSGENTMLHSEQRNPNRNMPQNQENTATQQTIVNNYGGSNNVSVGNNNQNKHEISEGKTNRNILFWTISAVIVAIIIGIITNWERIFR